MAKDDELELSSDDGKKSGGKKGLLLIIVGVVVLVAASVGATLFFTGALGGKDEGEAGAEEAAAEAVEQAPAYLDLTPEFIVNFEDQNRVSYLQVDIQVMSRDKDALKALETHKPRVRSELVLLLSGQNYQALSTREGKEKLAGDIRDALNAIVKKETGKEGIEEVYFTSFIMQ